MSRKICLRPLVAAVTAVLTVSPHVLQAQALEEIVVTAQRRTQSLQEVPIALEAISAAEMTRQGYRDLNSLSAFSPTVNVDQEAAIGPTISIRGFGTSGNAVTLESATPIFVDGIHFSRMSMMKTAFMDVEQVEVLKGPQPVYFGQNASAGAFNITSKKPGDTWEGDLDFEFGNRNTQEVNGGIGGPINDQWRIRVAGKYEDAGGYLNDVVSGDDLGAFEDIGGRITLQWLPSDQLVVTAKADYGRIRKDVEAVHICLTDASLIWGRSGPGVTGQLGSDGTIGQENSIFAPPPVGEGWNVPFATTPDNDCYGSRNGTSAGGPYYQAPDYIREENSDFGSLDVREAADAFAKIDGRGIAGYEDIDIWTTSLRFEYEFANGITADFNNGLVRYLRNYVRDNSYSNFFMNFQGREEDYYQWSSELRLDSEKGGTIEWNVSAFYQTGDLDVFSSSLRSELRTPQRYNNVWEDQEWFAGSGVFTFNFLDNRASIDVGGRIAKLNKTTFADGYAASWVYAVQPCNPGQNNFTANTVVAPGLENPTAASIAACTGTHNQAVQVTEDQVRILTDDPYDPANLWTIPYGTSGNQKRLIPPNWLPSQAHAIGLTNPDYALRQAAEGRDGALLGDFSRSEFDPQVTLRYRPTDDISVYGRWAQASKAGGYDTGQTSLSPVGYEFAPEYSETFEVGAKGSYLDGRGRFDVALFTLEFTDLQISVATSDPDNPFINLNAGSQRVRGLEFGTQFAVSDRMTVGLGGAILDGEFTNFPNSSCTEAESRDAATGPCLTAQEAIDLYGNDEAEDTIDRTGTKTPRTPDWKFIADVDYWMPVFDNYKLTFNAKGYYSDGYTTDFEGFTQTSRFDKHGDLNLILGFGDQNDVWSVSLYGRNLLQARPTYHREFDIDNDGLITTPVSPNYYATYGVKLTYNYH